MTLPEEENEVLDYGSRDVMKVTLERLSVDTQEQAEIVKEYLRCGCLLLNARVFHNKEFELSRFGPGHNMIILIYNDMKDDFD